jgi:hypothetical protein
VRVQRDGRVTNYTCEYSQHNIVMVGFGTPQELIPDSSVGVLPGDSFHVSVTDPVTCARATLEFIQ